VARFSDFSQFLLERLCRESDSPFGRWGRRLQQPTNGIENRLNLRVVLLVVSFQLLDFLRQLAMRRDYFAKLDEGPHDRDIHVHGAIAFKNAGEHGHALLGEA